MATAAIEMLSAGMQGAGEVEAGNRPAAALAVAVAQGNHDRGTIEAVDDARSDDTDDAAVPCFGGEDDAAALFLVEAELSALLEGFFENPALDDLPLAVLRLEIGCDLGGAGL